MWENALYMISFAKRLTMTSSFTLGIGKTHQMPNTQNEMSVIWPAKDKTSTKHPQFLRLQRDVSDVQTSNQREAANQSQLKSWSNKTFGVSAPSTIYYTVAD